MTHTPVKLTFEQYLQYDDGTDNRYELTEFSGNQQIVSRTFPQLGLTATQILEAR